MVLWGTTWWRQANGRPMLIVGSRPAVYLMAVIEVNNVLKAITMFPFSAPFPCAGPNMLTSTIEVNNVVKIITMFPFSAPFPCSGPNMLTSTIEVNHVVKIIIKLLFTAPFPCSGPNMLTVEVNQLPVTTELQKKRLKQTEIEVRQSTQKVRDLAINIR